MARTTFTKDGGWCWFQDPRAVRHAGEHDRTYVGWLTRGGDIQVGQYDHDAETVETTTLHADYERDDHNDPTFAVRPDGRLVAFYTRHGGPEVNYRISKEPEDVGAFGPERSLEPGLDPQVTYPNPRWIDGDLYLFLRNDGDVVCLVSTDGGGTWSDQRRLVSTGGEGWCVYSKLSRGRDGEVHLGLTHAIGSTNNPHQHVHHARFDGEALRASDGTVLGRVGDGSFPVSMYETTQVFDSDATGDAAWIWDCSTAGGVAQLAYAQLVSEDEHRYRYARWDPEDGGWTDGLLCHGGTHIVAGEGNDERYYSGGVVLDHDEPGVCYASIGSHDSSALERWERAGDGWRVDRLAEPDAQNVRPVVPWNRREDLGVCWMRGRYTYFAPAFSEDDDAAFKTAVVGRSLD